MRHRPLVIAVDGPAASGKGTLAKKIAAHFGLDYLDTGSIYRAVGYKVLQQGGSPEDKELAVNVARNINKKDLVKGPHLFDEGIGTAASIVSAIPEVREALLQFQKDFAKSPKGAVLDGRDIGTVVCPNADFKLYITADLEARAQRRYKELQNKGNSIIYSDVLKDLQSRDERDSKRTIAPLKKAEDAIHMDTTHMGVEEVFQEVLSIVTEGMSRKAGVS